MRWLAGGSDQVDMAMGKTTSKYVFIEDTSEVLDLRGLKPPGLLGKFPGF
jgi:hypothetical protein